MSSLSCVISPSIVSTFLKNAMISRFAASRSALPAGPPPSSWRAMASYSRRSAATDLSAIELENDGARILAQRRSGAEPLAQVDERDRAPLILKYAFEKLRRLRQWRRSLVAQNALDLENVEREVLTAHLERDQLDVVTAALASDRRHVIRSPSASRSRIGTRPSSCSATPAAHGSV